MLVHDFRAIRDKLLKIQKSRPAALHITQDNPSASLRQDELIARLNACPPKEKETALRLLEVYLQSLG